jgi:hypothetical protein
MFLRLMAAATGAGAIFINLGTLAAPRLPGNDAVSTAWQLHFPFRPKASCSTSTGPKLQVK